MMGATGRPPQAVEKLKGVPLLSGLSRRELREVVDASQEMQFPRGSTIAQEGSRAADLYVILEGHADVSIGGRRRRRLDPGDYFGEMSVIDGGPRTATVSAGSNLLVLRVPGRAFRRLLESNAKIATKLLLELAGRLRRGDAPPMD
jgi:CRP/FNR family transcriptional regulator, cyclic AMP receptor protein